VAIATMARDPVRPCANLDISLLVLTMLSLQIVAHVSELMTLKKMPTYSQIKGGKNVLEIPLTA
jgi:hypothetical protein